MLRQSKTLCKIAQKLWEFWYMVMQQLQVKVSFMNAYKWDTFLITSQMVSFTLSLTIRSVLRQLQPKQELVFIVLMLQNQFRPQSFMWTPTNHNLSIKLCTSLFNIVKSSIKIFSLTLLDTEDMATMNKINHLSLNLWCIKSSVKEKTCMNFMRKNLRILESLPKNKSIKCGMQKWKNLKMLMMSLCVKLLTWENGKLRTIIVLSPSQIWAKSKELDFQVMHLDRLGQLLLKSLQISTFILKSRKYTMLENNRLKLEKVSILVPLNH